MPTKNELTMLQVLPYEVKNQKTDLRIHEWVKHWGVDNVAVSISGGLDSCVLLHKVRKLYPTVKAVSIKNIECKENQRIVENTENIVCLTSEYKQVDIIKEFGFPIVSKKTAKSIRRLQNPTPANLKSRNLALTGMTSKGRFSPRFKLPQKWLSLVDSPFKVSEQCCYYMKEKPLADYARENDMHYFIGTKAEDSTTRESSYLGTGCNSFNQTGNSNPLGFWMHQDVLRYIIENDLVTSEIYGDVVEEKTKRKANKLKVKLMAKNNIPIKLTTTKASRSGCFICGFGVHL